MPLETSTTNLRVMQMKLEDPIQILLFSYILRRMVMLENSKGSTSIGMHVRKWFLAGCRKLIGFDGCHIKGAYPSLLLSAVGIDVNSGMMVRITNRRNAGANWNGGLDP